MTIRLEFEQMKMAYLIEIKEPKNLEALKSAAFDKAWECVSNHFKSCEKPLPKQRHGSASYACIRSDADEILSDEDLQTSLKKGIGIFQVRFKVPSHPTVPFVPFRG